MGSFQTFRTLAHAPRMHQRLNRRKTEFHLPNRSGRSRQGAVVRANYRTAFVNRRLSSALLGNRSLILFQASSVISCRRFIGFLPGPNQGKP